MAKSNNQSENVQDVRMATEAENRKDAEKASPKPDELQLKREAQAEAGMAHASLNGGLPQHRDEFSESEREGDDARPSADTVSPASRKVADANGTPVVDGKPAVESDAPRKPGVTGASEVSKKAGEDKAK